MRLPIILATAALLFAGAAQAQTALIALPAVAPAALPVPEHKPDLRSMPLVGTLKDPEAWRAYKARFVTDAGRVVDTANKGISHSEGQGYGMLLAVAANDRASFDAIWGWTRANLMVRDDELIAWRWEPNARPAVADMNDASDGDLLVAWALTEAAEAWSSVPYKIAARRIAVEVGRKLLLPHTSYGALMLPAVAGFAAEDRPDGPVVNLSYWVFPALARLPLVAPDVDWAGLSRNGLELVKQVHFGPANLPTDWISLHDASPRPADGFPQTFAYNSIRIPLYIAWAGLGQREIYAPFVSIWQTNGRKALPIIDASTGKPTDWLTEKGYGAVAALTACAASGTTFSREDRTVHSSENYYAVTLNLLALVAGHMRYASCFAN
jgi:endo-1,4-beta-D-glucanase Y